MKRSVFPNRVAVRLLVAKFFFQRCQDQPIDAFPYVGYKSNRLKVPEFVVIAEIIGLDPFIQNNDRLRQDVFPEPSSISRESPFMDSENHKANMAQNKLLGLGFAATLGLSN